MTEENNEQMQTLKRNKITKKPVRLRIDESTLKEFEAQSVISGIPYPVLINLYLKDCVAKKRKLELTWE